MKNIRTRIAALRATRPVRSIVLLALLCLAAFSNAQTAGGGATTVDLTPVTTNMQSQFVSFMTTNAPGLVSILLVGLALKLALKFLRRGVN